MSAIDWTKPIELSDGTPMKIIKQSPSGRWFRISENGLEPGRDAMSNGKPVVPDNGGNFSTGAFLFNGRTVRNVEEKSMFKAGEVYFTKNRIRATITHVMKNGWVVGDTGKIRIWDENGKSLTVEDTGPWSYSNGFDLVPPKVPGQELYEKLTTDQRAILGILVRQQTHWYQYLQDTVGADSAKAGEIAMYAKKVEFK